MTVTATIHGEDEIDARFKYVKEQIVRADRYPVTIEILPETRTLAMNRFLWGWLYRRAEEQLRDAGIEIVADDGERYPYTAEMLHYLGRYALLVKQKFEVNGEEHRDLWSTSQLARRSKDVDGIHRPSFKDYVDGFRRYCFTRWKITIEDPPFQVADYAAIADELRGRYEEE